MAEFHQIAGYDVISTLGTGAHSTIYAVSDKAGNKLILKRVVKDTPAQQRFVDQALAEHEVARKIDHPRVRKSLKVIKQRSVIRISEVMILMEMVDGLTLEQLGPTDILEICQIFYQAADGLKAMHAAGYVHADIKPNNIMIVPGEGVKLIDFGQSCKSGTIKERIQGTPDYIAPEQVKREAITERTDVFNLGATFYWVLTGKYVPTMIPKKQDGIALKTEDYRRCDPPMAINPLVPPALSSLIMDCIERRPADRPESMDVVMERLKIAAAQAYRQKKAMSAATIQPDAQIAGVQRSAG